MKKLVVCFLLMMTLSGCWDYTPTCPCTVVRVQRTYSLSPTRYKVYIVSGTGDRAMCDNTEEFYSDSLYVVGDIVK